LLAACSQPSREEQAAQAALVYYQLLLSGSADDFLAGKAGVDSLPADYRRQLAKSVEQYVADMKRRHEGLCGVAVSPNIGQTDTALHLTHAFLLLSYGDSTEEEITVPMVEEGGAWKIR